VVAITVPSIEAAEVEVFGASYRSLRGDHHHLFTWRSIDHVLARAGLRRIASTTECNVHLLRGFLSPDELQLLYASGRGPDALILAERCAV
jgi:hypothetical protein